MSDSKLSEALAQVSKHQISKIADGHYRCVMFFRASANLSFVEGFGRTPEEAIEDARDVLAARLDA